MTIKYLDSKRISGTTADRNGIPAVSGGWKELGRTTLGSTTSTIDVASLDDKRYLMILNYIRPSGAVDGMMRLNNDSGSNYACRFSNNGGSDGSDANASLMYNAETPSDTNPMFAVSYIANKSNKEKLHLSQSVAQKTAGTGNAPNRGEYACKWTNTSDAVDRITTLNSTGNSYASGSECVVLGWDPTDTHTTNFWEELGTTTASGSSSTLDVTFTGKKYLWIQAYTEPASSDTTSYKMGTGGSIPAGDNYTYRWSLNGGTDTAVTILSHVQTGLAAQTRPTFTNIFIVNTASNEKLGYFHTVCENTAGAGTAPVRSEGAFKFINTSAVMDIFRLYNNSSSNFNSNSFVKVWGSN